MIKNCRVSDLPQYGYDIKHNDEVIAKAHLLGIRDKTRLFQSLFTKKAGDSETTSINMDTAVDMICSALDSWEFANGDKIMPITKQNIDSLLPEYINTLTLAIIEAESAAMATAQGIEKN